jgi:hypothetical protein
MNKKLSLAFSDLIPVIALSLFIHSCNSRIVEKMEDGIIVHTGNKTEYPDPAVRLCMYSNQTAPFRVIS